MSDHYIIESYDAYEAIKHSSNRQKKIWHTTSPYILQRLPELGEETYSMEENISSEEMNKLAKVAYDFADDYCSWLNDICYWKDYADLNLIFSGTLAKCLFVTLYKGLTLQTLLDETKNQHASKTICVGNPDKIRLDGITMGYGRFDTLFSFLLSRYEDKTVGIYTHDIPSEKIDRINDAVINHKFGFYEKILSIINNTPSSFLYKLIKNCKKKGLFPFRYVQLFPWPPKSFSIYKDCELIDESFFGLLLRGAKIGWLQPMPLLKENVNSFENLPDVELLEKKFRDMAITALNKRGLNHHSIYDVCLDIVCERLLIVVERLRCNYPFITRYFSKITSSFRDKEEILTNGLFAPIERLFYCYCKKNNIKVNAFEHGITLGLSDESKWHARTFGMLAADAGFYHNQEAIDAIAPYSGHQKKNIAGIPKITEKPPLPSLQRWLVRKWLKIPYEEHVVMYVANLERNNNIYGPYNENDLHFLKSTKDIYKNIIKNFPDSLSVLKLYPSQRYLECYDFQSCFAGSGNSRIIKDMDFRYIRSAVDVIFVTSSQSTLGWVLGAGQPCFFLELEKTPISFDGFQIGSKKDKYINRVFYLTKKHHMMKSRDQKMIFHELINSGKGKET